MSGHIRPRMGTAVATILTMLLTVSVTACQTAPSKSVSAKQAPAPTTTPSTTLTPCRVIANWPVKPVTADVLAVVTQYYSAKHLTPITIYKNQEIVLDVKEQSAGVHYCRNLDGSTSGYVGAVPVKATAAVMVYVEHEPYPTTQTGSHFVTLAQMSGTGWTVVAEGTGP